MDCGRPSALPPAPATRYGGRPASMTAPAWPKYYPPAASASAAHQAPPGQGPDCPRGRRALRRRGITPETARRDIESSGRLGRHRYVVEGRWLGLVGRPRVQVRDQRHADILLGFVHLTCALSYRKSLNEYRYEGALGDG